MNINTPDYRIAELRALKALIEDVASRRKYWRN